MLVLGVSRLFVLNNNVWSFECMVVKVFVFFVSFFIVICVWLFSNFNEVIVLGLEE